jgi:integrase
MTKPNLRIVAPDTEMRKVTPRRRKNAELRVREYLTPDEVERLIEAVKANRHGARDAAMLLLAYRHGLRASELIDLRWSQVDFDNARLHVRRVKRGLPAVHPIGGDELRVLRKIKRESTNSEFVFLTERGSPFTRSGFAKIVEGAGRKAGFDFGVHAHMLRHATGYALANKERDTRSLQAYLGHRNIQHTTRYTELSPDRFRDFGNEDQWVVSQFEFP